MRPTTALDADQQALASHLGYERRVQLSRATLTLDRPLLLLQGEHPREVLHQLRVKTSAHAPYLVSDDSPELRTVFCTTLGQLLGLAKELYDSGQPDNHFSDKDLLWTAVGVLGSTLVFYLLEVLLPSETPQPPFAPQHAINR